MMRISFQNRFWSFRLFRVASLVWLKRSGERFDAADEIRAAFEELQIALDSIQKGNLRLLIDLREGPKMRNDPEFEALTAPYRQAIPVGFARSAILVRSAVGKLQVNRYNREDGGGAPPVFDAEPEALLFLGCKVAPVA